MKAKKKSQGPVIKYGTNPNNALLFQGDPSNLTYIYIS